MKKSLLLLSAVALTTAAGFAAFPKSVNTRGEFTPAPFDVKQADNNVHSNAPARENSEILELPFGYAGDVANVYSMNGVSSNNYVWLAFEIPAEDLSAYVGKQIVAVNVMSPVNDNNVNPISRVSAFVAEKGFSETPTLSPGYFATEPTTYSRVDLKEPYTITGDKTLVVGYQFKYSATCYYIPVDEELTDARTLLYAKSTTAKGKPTFSNYADQIGNLCCQAVIQGEDLPINLGSVSNMEMDFYVNPSNKISYSAKVKNMGANDINNVVIRSYNGSELDNSTTVNFSSPIKPGTSATVTVSNIPNPEQGLFMLYGSVVKVNDVEVPANAVTSKSAIYGSYTDGYSRAIVVEEGTGVNCGWCPRGMVMMDYLRENYPDWILIGVHGAYGADPMTPASYEQMIYDYFPGAPMAVANREIEVTVGGAVASYYRPVQQYFDSYPAYTKVDVQAVSFSEDGKNLNLWTETEFSLNTSVEHRLAFVTVEDGVGPYDQLNYYAGGGYGVMGGWERLGSSVSTIYNDVARYLSGYPGNIYSIPYDIEAGKTYSLMSTIPVRNINADSFRVVALVVNTITGNIVNAKEITVLKSGISDVVKDNDSMQISVENGSINVKGAANVAVYTLDGRRVDSNSLAKGVYIVTADGRSTKVFVK